MVNDEQGYYVLAQHGGLYSRGFSISVIISILLLFNCMTSRNFGSNVSVMIGDAKQAVNKTEISFLIKSTAEFMILTHTPDARDLRCGLLSRRATGSYEETLEFARFEFIRVIFETITLRKRRNLHKYCQLRYRSSAPSNLLLLQSLKCRSEIN